MAKVRGIGFCLLHEVVLDTLSVYFKTTTSEDAFLSFYASPLSSVPHSTPKRHNTSVKAGNSLAQTGKNPGISLATMMVISAP